MKRRREAEVFRIRRHRLHPTRVVQACPLSDSLAVLQSPALRAQPRTWRDQGFGAAPDFFKRFCSSFLYSLSASKIAGSFAFSASACAPASVGDFNTVTCSKRINSELLFFVLLLRTSIPRPGMSFKIGTPDFPLVLV